MKKIYLILITLFCTLSMLGQNQTFTGVKTFTTPPRFSNLIEGTKNDSILVYGEDKILKYIPRSQFAGGSGDFVTLTQNDSISGHKRFKHDITFDNNIILGDNINTATGIKNTVTGRHNFVQGMSNSAVGNYIHVEGRDNTASAHYTHAEGQQTHAKREGSHAEGYMSNAEGDFSHAEGRETGSYTNVDSPNTPNYFYSGEGNYTHTEGFRTVADSNYSHAEGKSNATFAQYSHVEGDSNTTGYPDHSSPDGVGSHAEGYSNHTYADYSHVEGKHNETYGEGSHAEGYKTIANGFVSHSSGIGTVTNEDADGQFAMGKYNIDTPDALGVIGNGTDDSNRSNLVEFYNDSIIFNQPVTFAGGGGAGCGCEAPQTIEIENPSCDPDDQPLIFTSKNVVVNVIFDSGTQTAGFLLPQISGTQGTKIDIVMIYNGSTPGYINLESDDLDGDIIVGKDSQYLNNTYSLDGKTVYTVRSNGVYWIVD